MSYPTDRPATWFVTGASRGLGLELTWQLLERGDNVAATTRSPERLAAALGSTDTTRLPGQPDDLAGAARPLTLPDDLAGAARLLALPVDLADEKAVAGAVETAEARFGPIDVVVNNAGYGLLAAVEEVSDAEARELFDVQVFGSWNVLRAVLPGMRARRSGHILNISSILGLTTFPGWGAYCAAKYALEGLTGSLAGEVAGFGIRVNLVEPGYMRTDFLRTDSLRLPARTADGYDAMREMTDAHLAMPGSQLGDPVKAAAAIITIAETGTAPLHQLLGSDSYGLAKARIDALADNVEAGHELARSTDIATANA